ncbi:Hypothetical predicted protein [Olea europaea subsp. europaea]|uniref:Uncharacterized protein n=1 Tax=Olea europaea subsp. europaea TaxID=158383 RepID=A0A8S0PXR9_OLEEU|nr:Hypothetical predicted protein [Olea europaea subsp. europaea]
MPVLNRSSNRALISLQEVTFLSRETSASVLTILNILEVDVERVARGPNMVVVHNLDKSLHARFLGLLLGGLFTDNLTGILGYAGKKAVAVGAVTRAVVKGFNNGGFVPGETAL